MIVGGRVSNAPPFQGSLPHGRSRVTVLQLPFPGHQQITQGAAGKKFIMASCIGSPVSLSFFVFLVVVVVVLVVLVVLLLLLATAAVVNCGGGTQTHKPWIFLGKNRPFRGLEMSPIASV